MLGGGGLSGGEYMSSLRSLLGSPKNMTAVDPSCFDVSCLALQCTHLLLHMTVHVID